MALPVEQFVKHLTDSGLMSAADILAFQDKLPPDKKPKDGQDLARELLRQKILTRFQAEAVNQGRTKGLVLGNYVLLDKIGAGGMGQVYKARHSRMERIVAVKVLPSSLTRDDNAVKRFHQEVKAAAKLTHPNIVTAHDADESKGVHFLVMECVEADDLSAIIQKNGPMSVGRAVHCILQAAKGLEYAHKKGVVHRDIKPGNLLLDAEGTLKILDMGLARIDESPDAMQATMAAGLTQTGQILGTIDFMPPEQALNTRHADHRADIYSLGCTLYYLLGARFLFDGETMMERLVAHREHPIPSLRALREGVPEGLDTVFQRMVAKNPEDRQQSMSEVIAGLQAVDVGGAESFSGISPSASPGNSGSTIGKPTGALLVGGKKQVTKRAAETGAYQATRDTTIDVLPGKVPSRSRPGKKRLLLVGSLVAAGLAAVLLAGVILNVKTASGTLVVEINEPDAVVQVLTEQDRVEITRKNGKGMLSITVDPGKHRLKVEKDGFQLFTREFTVEAGGKAAITAKLVPLEVKPIARNPADKLKGRAFEQWVKRVAAMAAEKQVEAVAARLKESNPGFDGKVTHKIEGGVVTELQFSSDKVTDISPVGTLAGLRTLLCSGNSSLTDLTPLKNMKLTTLECGGTKVSDLSPLKDMKLTHLNCEATHVSDLTPLRDVKLMTLNCGATKVSDLSPLKNMPLTNLCCWHTQVSDLSPLKDMKLMSLSCDGTKVSDLPPLKGMKLTQLTCPGTKVSSLSPLKDMKLIVLVCDGTKESDLSPLKGMPLTDLHCGLTKVSDISPLKGMVLTQLNCSFTPVSDLSPLKDMKLTNLFCNDTEVFDLSPLKNMKLTVLWCYNSPVSNLSVLKGMPLKNLRCDFKPERDDEILRAIKTLETINGKATKEFWKELDAKKP